LRSFNKFLSPINANDLTTSLSQASGEYPLATGQIKNPQLFTNTTIFVLVQIKHAHDSRDNNVLMIFAALITDKAIIPIGYASPMRLVLLAGHWFARRLDPSFTAGHG
jgi:hypothetical protein